MPGDLRPVRDVSAETPVTQPQQGVARRRGGATRQPPQPRFRLMAGEPGVVCAGHIENAYHLNLVFDEGLKEETMLRLLFQTFNMGQGAYFADGTHWVRIWRNDNGYILHAYRDGWPPEYKQAQDLVDPNRPAFLGGLVQTHNAGHLSLLVNPYTTWACHQRMAPIPPDAAHIEYLSTAIVGRLSREARLAIGLVDDTLSE